MAKLMTGVYNADEVQQLIYDLVKVGVARHTIAIVDDQGVDMHDGALNREVVEGKASKHRSALSQGRVLVVAWVMASWTKRVQKVMEDYKPVTFEQERAVWQPT